MMPTTPIAESPSAEAESELPPAAGGGGTSARADTAARINAVNDPHRSGMWINIYP